MKKEFDFSKAKRGMLPNLPPIEELDRHTKVRITMFVDNDVLKFFRARAAKPGAEPYQTQINRVLRQYAAAVDPSRTGGTGHVAERSGKYSSATKRRARRRESKAAAPRGRALQRTVKVVVRPGEEFGWMAECVELPVVTQGATLDEVAANLREAVALHLEGEDLGAFGLAPDPCLLVTLELPAAHA